jgi:ATP-binding cassette subfamily B protein
MAASKTIKQKIRQAFRLHLALRFVWESARGWTIASIILIVIQSPLPLVPLYLTKLLIDSVTASLENGGDINYAFWQEAALIILLMGLTSLLQNLIGAVAGLVREAQSLTVTDHMYDVIHAKSIAVDLEYYENPSYYDTLGRAQQEAPYRPTNILRGLTQVGQSSLSLLAMTGLLLTFHWAIGIILLAAVIPGIYVRLRYSGKLYRWQRKRTQTQRRASYFSWMLTGNQHAKEVRLFKLGALFTDRFRNLRTIIRHEKIKITFGQALAGQVAQLLSIAAVYGSYAFVTHQTLQGAVSLGSLVIYYQAFQRARGYLSGLLNGLASLYEDNLFLSNLYEFLDLEPKITPPQSPSSIPRPIQHGITFNQVSFQYPTGTRTVLKDVSLSIQPGEKIALVGENGSGKTTLIKLLCRLYDPTGGEISVDGIPLTRFDITALRQEISVIFQDYAQYHLTAQENIWFGNIERLPDSDQIATAASRAGIDEVITALPKGYDTILGKLFEEGEELSIGEWQKVALARAFLRDAQIIVLDEPTSALDAKAEHEVFTTFYELTQNQIGIIISHRFSTVRMADCIFVLEDGRIIEHGSHDELMRLDGTYARMFNLQAQHYIT